MYIYTCADTIDSTTLIDIPILAYPWPCFCVGFEAAHPRWPPYWPQCQDGLAQVTTQTCLEQNSPEQKKNQVLQLAHGLRGQVPS